MGMLTQTVVIGICADRMTSFTWKQRVNKQKINQCGWSQSSDEEEEEVVDWLTASRPSKAICLEDAEAKVRRLEREATFFAENERYAEGINRLIEAVQLKNDDARLHEMLSQLYHLKGEDFLAVQSAEKAVQCDPLWSVGYQTLGRMQLNLGEVLLAVRSFCRAIYLNPFDSRELRDEDLPGALSILRAQRYRIPSANGHQPQPLTSGDNRALVRPRQFIL